ncbi:MAG: NADH-quinone oxidoreductase subunit N [Cyclobacteriaceae bacterium]|nr:NADH-quinone oxidoreductase subunit N [Cyclobacteriaceae bacterium]MCB0498408.1 NADH-quinone oxidoreductase subunit N [Cyclobacteriaceae bacterium]MCB9237022.1 NADH-quinone oxidoreductase subunit N [Flammeovirgaceae bacterium]MCO5271668.1 NADH-quinone oxidoreductase subunit N [Cyclobacteriaceae bacterium]MCW5901268.1 NADH-quinone oxidoreductase subunit N [Cyclobacteriaceae bacterium]
MSIQELLLMRHEWALILLVLAMLVLELGFSEQNKTNSITAASILFAVVTLLGFLPSGTGSTFGGMYVASPVRILMKNILNLGVLIVFLQSGSWLRTKPNYNRVTEFYLLVLSSVIGLNFMISAGHFLMFYLGLELLTIPITAASSYEQYKSKSAEAGIKLILSSAFSSAILLFGISMLYGTMGSLYFHDMQAAMELPQVLGFVFFFSGLAFKISIVPFHLWTADVYEGSPTSVTSYLSVVSKGAAIFMLILILTTIFEPLRPVWQQVLYGTAIFTMTIGNLFAIRQQNLKRFLAFSSIAQAGFILLGMIGGSALGMASVLYFVLVYVFSNLAAFGVVMAIEQSAGKVDLKDYNGLYKTNPRLSLVMMLALFSLAGIPPLAGFFGKFFLFAAAAESGYYVLLFIAVINAVISLYYYLLVVKAMFIIKSDMPIGYFQSDYPTRMALSACVIGILALGFYSPVFEYIQGLCLTYFNP